MRALLLRGGIAVIFSILAVSLFFNAINLSDNYYRADMAIWQAQVDYADMMGMIDKLDQSVLDLSQGGIIKDTTREIGKGAGGLLQGLGKFLNWIADATEKPKVYPPKVESLKPSDDDNIEVQKLLEQVTKLATEKEQKVIELREKAVKNKEIINSFRTRIESRQEVAKKIKSEIPSVVWQWILFLLAFWGTIIAWYKVFFPVVTSFTLPPSKIF